MDELYKKIEDKYKELGQDHVTYLKGLYHTRPINYWDYINLEALLSLQHPKTNYKDEYIFIVYHQITELVLRLIVHELEQVTSGELNDKKIIDDKLHRMMRYTDMLITSFSVMNKGMSYDDYNEFRLALAPASGFQSAQFRIIELYCTTVDNLIQPHKKTEGFSSLSTRDKFELIYWQDAGKDHKTGKKSLTLTQFENKYLNQFIELAEKMKNNNLSALVTSWEMKGWLDDELKSTLKAFDRKFNIEWPMVHLVTAHTYLGSGKAEKAATGGSHWEKYLHPKYQRRIFFPQLLTEDELTHWGEN